MMGSTLLQLDFLNRTRETQLDRWRASPMETRAIDKFKEGAREIHSLDDFMKNDAVYNFVMKAYGLEEMAFAKAFIRKIVEEGTSDPDSMANKMIDPRYKELAKDLGFDTFANGTKVRNPAFIERTVEKYVVGGFEAEQGETNVGVQLSLYFERKASSITNWYQVLGDKALTQVVRTALGIPQAMAGLDVDKQVEFLERRMNIEDFQDPAKVKKFVSRFAVMHDIETGGANSGRPLSGAAGLLMASPLNGPPPIITIDPATISAMNFYRNY